MTFFKKKTIYREDSLPYLIRYTLFSCSFISFKIHHILRSDEACLHDHPWSFISILLRGYYVEHTEAGVKLFGPLSVLFRRAKLAHRLEIEEPVWSFVITFKKVRQWGFWTKQGWVIWFKYQRSETCE